MKALLCIVLVLASTYSHATELTIEKSASPRTIRLVNHDSAASYFQIKLADMPKGAYGTPMKVKELSWSTTHYPYSNIDERVRVCYYPYGDLPKNPEICDEAAPNSTGISRKFKDQRFGYETKIKIIHEIYGGRQIIKPAGADMITLRYSR